MTGTVANGFVSRLRQIADAVVTGDREEVLSAGEELRSLADLCEENPWTGTADLDFVVDAEIVGEGEMVGAFVIDENGVGQHVDLEAFSTSIDRGMTPDGGAPAGVDLSDPDDHGLLR